MAVYPESLSAKIFSRCYHERDPDRIEPHLIVPREFPKGGPTWLCFNRPQFPNQRGDDDQDLVAEGDSEDQEQDDGWPEQHVDAEADKQAGD